VVQLIVQFRPELDVTYSEGVFRSSSVEAIEPINKTFRNFPDALVEPLFSGNESSIPAHMRYYFTIHLSDADKAKALEELLQQQTSVEAAYIKPPAELP